MSFVAKKIEIQTDRRVAVLNEKDAARLALKESDRVKVHYGGRSASAILSVSSKLVAEREAGIFDTLNDVLQVRDGDQVEVKISEAPQSVQFIKKKMMEGVALTKEEIGSIVQDIVNLDLSDLEMAAFVMSQHFRGMNIDEAEALTRSMVETGEIIEFERPVYDKHSVGGVPGNKVSLLIVPMTAAAGLFIPKLSSHAITSPSGTADTMQVLTNVDFSIEEFKEAAMKAGGAIAASTGLNISPADDILIRHVEHPLGIDPVSQMAASIMSKKLAVGAKFLLLDIPTGKESKVETEEEARSLASMFIELGRRVGMRVACGITFGGAPVGHAVGPALEAREALLALAGKAASTSLVEKSTSLTGMMFELAGVASQGQGKEMAEATIRSGKALAKMREIIAAQGGNPNVRPEDIPVGSHIGEIKAQYTGYVTRVSNAALVEIARAAGAPAEKGAGFEIEGKVGHFVKKGDVILRIYAERESRLEVAHSLALHTEPIVIEGMLLDRIP